MNKPLTTATKLQIELYCREVAIRLNAAQMLDFMQEPDGEAVPMLWCGGAFLDGILEPDDVWEPINWSEMPLLADLYNKFGAAGIYFWAAYRRQARRTDLRPEVRKIYKSAEREISAHIFRRSMAGEQRDRQLLH